VLSIVSLSCQRVQVATSRLDRHHYRAAIVHPQLTRNQPPGPPSCLQPMGAGQGRHGGLRLLTTTSRLFTTTSRLLDLLGAVVDAAIDAAIGGVPGGVCSAASSVCWPCLVLRQA
jgi:hypothetical protein